MSKTIYIVFGATGSYEDAHDWPVIAFMDKDKADTHRWNAQRRADELECGEGYPWNILEGANPFDPKMEMDLGGTQYSVVSIDLEE